MGRDSDTPKPADQDPEEKSPALEPTSDQRAKERREIRQMWRAAGEFGYIGIEFGVATAIGYFAGSWLDEKLGTEPWLTISLSLCGIAAAAIDLYKLVKRAQKDNP